MKKSSKTDIYFLIGFLAIALFIVFLYHGAKIVEAFNQGYILPKTIWCFWDDPEMPEMIRYVQENNRLVLGSSYDIRVLNRDTLQQYVDVFPPQFNELGIQHKADYIRLFLLSKYGGIWSDASIIINSKPEFDALFNQVEETNTELLAFTLGDDIDGIPYHPFIENWFLIAPKNSKVINKWLEEFNKAIDMGFENYINDVRKTTKISDSLNSWGSYLTMHFALQKSLQDFVREGSYQPKIILNKSSDTMHKLHSICNWNDNCIINSMKNEPNKVKMIPFIKLSSGYRNLDINYKEVLQV